MLSFKSVITVCVLLVTLILHGSVSAQSEESKIEVGAQFSVLGRGHGYWFDEGTSIGGGGRLTFNLTRYLALEGEMNYFPSAGFNDIRRFQGQFGVKSGLRYDRFGVFGKVRPGFVNTKYDLRVLCIQAPCSPITVKDTGFSLDVGGVVEFYPSRRITVRFDVGDTILNRHGRQGPLTVPGSLFGRLGPSHTTHNLQLSAGIGFRF